MFKKKFLLLSIFLTIFCNQQSKAQTEAGALFLLISPSPQANGSGNVYLPYGGNDPFAPIYNPAHSGFLAQNNLLTIGTYVEKTKWLPSLTNNVTYNSNSYNFGYNFKNISNIPLAIGVGANEVKFEYGEGAFQTYDQRNSWTISLSFDYFLKASVGWGFSDIDSKLTPEHSAKVSANDFGLIFQLPIVDIGYKVLDKDRAQFSPFFTPTFWYSKNNVSDNKLIYIDASQADPLPRMARMGTSFAAGLIFSDHRVQNWNLFTFEWGAQAEDLLVERFPDGSWEYKSGVGDIQFFENLVQGKSNPDIFKMKGWQYNFFDLIYIRNGSYKDPGGKVFHKTEGLGIRPTGIFNILNYLGFSTDSNRLFYLLTHHVDIQYNESKWGASSGHPLDGTKFKSITLTLK